jgi:glucose/arabinose dehydrogenase
MRRRGLPDARCQSGRFRAALFRASFAAISVAACTGAPEAPAITDPASTSQSTAVEETSDDVTESSAVAGTAPSVSDSAAGSELGTSSGSVTSAAPITSTTSSVVLPVEPEDVVTGLQAPWSVAFVDGTALVSERDAARILELTATGTREIGRVAEAVPGGEGGLLGLAVLKQGSQQFLYSYLTTADDNRIVRFALSGSAGSWSLGNEETIFSGIPKARNHNGGRIAFGPDGMLYATAGDAGNPRAAQDPTSLSGKILRLTPDGTVPADNPIPGNPLFSLGHRNPQGIGWQPDGTMWAAEFGQNTWDELNMITAGANYGWPEVEGIGEVKNFVDPVAVWPTSAASPSGIAVVGDTVYIACLRGQRLLGVSVGDPGSNRSMFTQQFGRLRDAVVAPDGALWLVTNNTDGRGEPHEGDDRILRLAPPEL